MYELVCWPEIQDYMDKPGFNENCCLANDEYFVDNYGSAAYFIEKSWKDLIDKTLYED